MASIIYVGESEAQRHQHPYGEEIFPRGLPVRVPMKVARFYLSEAERGGPWVVRLSLIEKIRRTIT